MNSLIDKLQEDLIPISQKISENKVPKAISKGFFAMLPGVLVPRQTPSMAFCRLR